MMLISRLKICKVKHHYKFAKMLKLELYCKRDLRLSIFPNQTYRKVKFSR